jgi:phosphate-selective porin OprO/OprP
MRRGLIYALASVLALDVALWHNPVRGEDLPPTGELVLPQEPQAPPRASAEEIKQLKAAVARLQDQIDHLSAAPDAAPADSLPRELVGTLPADEDAPVVGSFLNPSFPVKATKAQATTDEKKDEEKDKKKKEDKKDKEKKEEDDPLKMSAKWDNGLVIETKDKDFQVHVGGRAQFDSGWNSASQAVQFGPGGTGELQDGALFRRARLRIDGTMYQWIDWVVEFDFANDVENDASPGSQPIGSPSFTNVWIGFNEIPYVGTVRAGWLKEPIGFQHLMSSRWYNFMESSPGIGSLNLRSAGVLMRNTSADERVTWSAGVFHVQNDNFGFGFGDGEYSETGRLTWLPWYEDEGYHLLHLGIGLNHRHLDNDQIELRGRPSVRTMPGPIQPALADTGTIGGSSQEVLDLELAGVYGPWTLQSEYYCTWIHDAIFPNQPPPVGVPRDTLFYQGCYVELLYFLTGEYRAYNLKDAVFDRVVPLRNFNIRDCLCGGGAWQVGVRYGFLDLQDKGVNGATLHDIVLGLNWFLNPNVKIQWNLAIDHRSSTPPGSSGWTYIAGTRLAMDF